MGQPLAFEYRTPNRSHHLRAEGSLTYLQFIRVVEALWREAHPQVPLVAAGGSQQSVYPVVVYSLQMRKPHPTEPKPRFREEIYGNPGEGATIISGQRFQNIVNFSVITERDPLLAEELIESFEDFMLEYTNVFKRLGISEFVYARRLPDDEESRPGEGIVKRTVSYLVTTEKVLRSPVGVLEEIYVRARRALVDQATFNAHVDGSLSVFGVSFELGERVRLYRHGNDDFPGGLEEGRIYFIQTVRPSASGDREYLLSVTRDAEDYVPITSPASGYIALAPEGASSGSVQATIEDQFDTSP